MSEIEKIAAQMDKKPPVQVPTVKSKVVDVSSQTVLKKLLDQGYEVL